MSDPYIKIIIYSLQQSEKESIRQHQKGCTTASKGCMCQYENGQYIYQHEKGLYERIKWVHTTE